MYKILLMFLLFLTLSAQAQTADNSQTERYCMVKATAKLLSKKVTIDVDYGQEQKLFSFKDVTSVKDEAGMIKSFNSVIDALNYMASRGWKMVQAFVVTEDTGMGKQNVYNYLMKKEILPKD